MRDCAYRLRPLKRRLPSHLLLNPLFHPQSASHVLLFCFSCYEMCLTVVHALPKLAEIEVE